MLVVHWIAHGLLVHTQGQRRTLMLPFAQQASSPPPRSQHSPRFWVEHDVPAAQLVMLLQWKTSSGQAGACTLTASDVWKPAARAAATR